MGHPIENIMKATMESLDSMVDVNTIVGEPILTGDDTMVLPVSKVSMGFLSGGGEYGGKSVKKAGDAMDECDGRYPFAGTAAGGMCLTPMAFLAVKGDSVRVLPAQYKDSTDRVVSLIPESICALERILKNVCKCGEDAEKPEEKGKCRDKCAKKPESLNEHGDETKTA